MVKNKIKGIYTSISLLLTTAFIVIGIFVFNESYMRVGESFVDLYQAIRYYFHKLFNLNTDFDLNVNAYSKHLTWANYLPDNFSGFIAKVKAYLELFLDKNNFIDWLRDTGSVASVIAKVLAIVLPCILALVFLIKKLYRKPNVNHNEDTLALKIFKKFEDILIDPIKNFIKGYIEHIKDKDEILTLWSIIWLINLNIASIFVDFCAYYLFFAVTFSFKTLYLQFAKFIIDIQVIIKQVPFIIPICIVIFYIKMRKNFALNMLDRLERRNRGFINELPIVSMTCGSMGKRKTTIITDMALSQEIMFRDVAFEKIQKLDMKFPQFPWICFENELMNMMEKKEVYNLATTKQWVEKKREEFDKTGDIYGYDYKKYGDTFDDKLKISNLFEILETYAKLFFIYIIQSSLIVANYSIRVENNLQYEGNFPLWQAEFFRKRTFNGDGEYCHLLDFDILRLGKKVIENNKNNGSFEFGVINISEVGKERGNNLELKEMKKVNGETNQKNDLFNSWLKMCRHSATVDGYPFIKVFTDEQRPESWGADARDLCDIVNIVSSGDTKTTLPGYTLLEEGVCEWIWNKFISLYYELRFIRGDNTLLMYLFKKLASIAFNYNLRVYNQYGYSVSQIEKERGTMDGKVEKKKYYILNKKIYSQRFSTDCFCDYFNEMASKSGVGLDDYDTYEEVKASVEELRKQNSYFIKALYDKDIGSS